MLVTKQFWTIMDKKKTETLVSIIFYVPQKKFIHVCNDMRVGKR